MICKVGGDNDQTVDTQQLHNLRLTKIKLKKYLSKRYNSRLAGKLCALFDWSNNLNYKDFYQQFDNIIINCHSNLHQDSVTHLISLKQIGFNIYDMNSDNSICEYDLFSLIKHTSDDSLFIETINQDLKDIRRKMAQKSLENLVHEQKKPIDDETFEIRDLNKWLSDKRNQQII